VNPGTDCERVRLQLMAALDGETVPDVMDQRSDARRHLSSCSSCERWLKNLESLNGRFHAASYPRSQVDLCAGVDARIRRPDASPTRTHRLWLIGALVIAWRALQLMFDLPLPMLHPLVPLAAAVAALWQISGDPLAIETAAPELQKRGV
jgi:predicted anti-sigma-YlaC factor YlaD